MLFLPISVSMDLIEGARIDWKAVALCTRVKHRLMPWEHIR